MGFSLLTIFPHLSRSLLQFLSFTGILSPIPGDDKSTSHHEGRVFRDLEEDLSESLGTSLPTDLTLTTTMADRIEEEEEEEEDTDENQNKVSEFLGDVGTVCLDREH